MIMIITVIIIKNIHVFGKGKGRSFRCKSFPQRHRAMMISTSLKKKNEFKIQLTRAHFHVWIAHAYSL